MFCEKRKSFEETQIRVQIEEDNQMVIVEKTSSLFINFLMVEIYDTYLEFNLS